MSVSNKYNHTIFTAFLLHCIENISNHSSGKCPDALAMAAMSVTKSADFGTIFIDQYLPSNSVINS